MSGMHLVPGDDRDRGPRGWWARLREAYEAGLLEDAESESRPRRSYLVTARDPLTGESRVVARGPRPLPVGSWFLRPQFLQFGLPVSAVGGLAAIARWGEVAGGLSGGLTSVGALVSMLVVPAAFGVWWNTLLGGWIFSSRWKRLRGEAYDAWTFRLAAARESAHAIDGVPAEPRAELEEIHRPTRLGR